MGGPRSGYLEDIEGSRQETWRTGSSLTTWMTLVHLKNHILKYKDLLSCYKNMTHKQTEVKHQTIEEFNKDNSISLSSPNSTDYFIPVQFGVVFARIYTPGQKHARNMSGQVGNMSD